MRKYTATIKTEDGETQVCYYAENAAEAVLLADEDFGICKVFVRPA